MTHTLRRSLWAKATLAAALAAALAAPASVLAQQTAPRGTADMLAKLAAKPTPHLNGKPDFNATWDHLGGIEFVRPEKLPDGSICLRGCAPAAGAARPAPAPAAAPANRQANPPQALFPKYKPEFLAKVKDLSARQVETDNVLKCLAPGIPRLGPPNKIVQNSKEVVFLYDDVNGAFFRIIPVDGRTTYRKDMPASFLGDSIGHFEGDTLVVETTNFNEDTWLTDNGAFHTTGLKVVERLRRVGDTIEYTATSHDPAVLVEPWTSKPYTMWVTSQEIEEPARCEDRDLEHIVDGSHHDNPR